MTYKQKYAEYCRSVKIQKAIQRRKAWKTICRFSALPLFSLSIAILVSSALCDWYCFGFSAFVMALLGMAAMEYGNK